MSKHSDLLSARQYRGLERLGDVMLPGNGTLPSFSKSGCATGIDHVVRYLPESDRNDLLMLLGILGLFPSFFTGWFVWLIERSMGIPTGLGSLLRFARIGTRGLIMSLYWGHEPNLAAIGYDVDVYLGDRQPSATRE
jgi:hypothetical protein